MRVTYLGSATGVFLSRLLRVWDAYPKEIKEGSPTDLVQGQSPISRPNVPTPVLFGTLRVIFKGRTSMRRRDPSVVCVVSSRGRLGLDLLDGTVRGAGDGPHTESVGPLRTCRVLRGQSNGSVCVCPDQIPFQVTTPLTREVAEVMGARRVSGDFMN